MRDPFTVRLAAALLALLASVSCGSSSPAHTIEIDGDVRVLLRRETGKPNVQTVNGHPYGIRDGEFFIGEATFGVVSEGAHISLTPAGVTISGERRGPLPAAVATSGD